MLGYAIHQVLSILIDQTEIQSYSDNSNSSVENMEMETLDEFTGELELQSSVITTEG